MEITVIIIAFLAIIAFFGAMFAFATKEKKLSQSSEKPEKDISADESEDEQELEGIDCEPQFEEIPAKILSQRCGVYVEGMKVPRSGKCFAVTFLKESGESVEYQVSEDFYLSLSEGQTGILVTVNGNFYGFAVDEPQENE